MNTKEKFDDIKLSMLPEKTRETLDKIRKATKDFSIDNAKATDYISAVHKKLKEEKPQSLYSMDKKPEPKKVEPKKTPVAKAKPEPKTPEPTKTQIKQSVSKVNSLQYALDNDPLLKNLGKTDKNRDAVRLAMPRGRRVSQKGWKNQYGTSKGGRVYYENRENRTDRKSPEFKDGYPYLEHGGNIHRAESHSYMDKGGKLTKLSKEDVYNGTHFFKRFNGAIGSFAWIYDKKYNEGVLYPLDEFDREFYSHLKLRDGQKLFRMETDKMRGKFKPLVKINMDKMLIYFMEDSDDEKNPTFNSLGTKLVYLNIVDGDYMAKGGEIKVIKLSDDDKLNYFIRKEELRENRKPFTSEDIKALDDMLTTNYKGKKFYSLGYDTKDKGRAFSLEEAKKNALFIKNSDLGKKWDVLVKEVAGSAYDNDFIKKTYVVMTSPLFPNEMLREMRGILQYENGGEMERDCKANEVMKDAKTLSKNLKKTYYVFEEVLFDYTARSEYKKYTVGDKEDYDYIYDAKDLGRSLKTIAVIATYDKGVLVSERYEVIYAKTPRFENGGEMDEDEGVDLFEDYDDQPEEVSAILEKYDLDDANYETLKELHDELKSVGYTFEYGLDGYAYDLRKIGQKGKSEFYAKGGKLSSNITYEGKKVNIISKKKIDNGDIMYFVEIPNYYKNGDTLRTVLRKSDFDKEENKNYVNRRNIKVIVVRNPNKNSTQNFLQIDKSDFLDGLHLFEKGGKISKNEYLYIPRRDVSQVVYRTKTESTKIESKPKNGFWVRKDALIKAGMNVNKNQAKVEFENTNLRKSKSFGWVADTYTIGDINGYVWKISTVKRGVNLISQAQAGTLKDGVWSFMVFKDPTKVLMSNEESRITSAKVEKQHEQALKIFNEYFRDGLLPEKKEKGGELSEGIKTEMKEHGMSKKVATKTAKDHLKEDSKYYTKMKKAGIGETTKNKKVSTKPKSKTPSLRGSKSVLVIAKQIRKEGENWQDAIKRAKEMNK